MGAEAGAPTELFGSVERFLVDGVEFRCSTEEAGLGGGRFAIRKDRRLVEEYVALLDRFEGANIVELGIADGGSVALAALVARPRRFVALELAPEPVAPLAELLVERGLADRVRPFYGVDQADRARVLRIAREEFGGEPVDLVVDDASHSYGATLASFETLFPLLRPGGLFVIEDWNHQHLLARRMAPALADPASPVRAELERRVEAGHEPPLSRLAMEVLVAHAESEEAIARVATDLRWLTVTRGAGALDPATFRLAGLITDDLGLLTRPGS